MSSVSPLIERYRRLRDVSRTMLSLARDQQWESLIQHEAEYVVELDRVKVLDSELALSEPERVEKLILLESTLQQDAETRRLLETRRDELSQLIGSSRRRQALGQAYRAGRGTIASRLRSMTPDERL